MNSDELKAIQAPFKEKYRSEPESALATLTAKGNLDFETISCSIHREADSPTLPGLHPMAGGNGQFACPAEMLLEALVGCAGVTLGAVCSAMSIPVDSAVLVVEGDLDFRGTLGVNRETPIGFTAIRLRFEIASSDPDEKLSKAVQLAERYCVVAQSLKNVSAEWKRI